MEDFTLSAFKALDKKELEQHLTKYLLDKCGCHAEVSALVSDPGANIHSWDIGEITFKIRRFGRVGSVQAC